MAVVDLGSNSFQAFIAEADADGRVEPVLVEREMLHLGRFMTGAGVIPAEAATDAVHTAMRLSELSLEAGAERVLAVATSALRDAGNGAAIVAAIERAIGHEVKVLSGAEEARLAFVGAAAGLPDAKRLLVSDLGGGSLELASGRAPDAVDWAASAPLGVSRLAAEAEVGEVLTEPGRKRLKKIVRERLASEAVGRPARAHADLVVAGGAARAVARVVLGRSGGGPPESLHGRIVDPAEVTDLSRWLVGVSAERRLALPGAKARRSLHLPVAAVVVSETARQLDARRLVVSEWSLRQGLILESLRSDESEICAS